MEAEQLSFDFMKGAQGASEYPEYPKGCNGSVGPDVDPHKDDVNQPYHYTAGKIEVYDFIKAWGLTFAEGNVIKYTVRAPFKGSTIKDLKKARWYLDQLIKQAEEEGHY